MNTPFEFIFNFGDKARLLKKNNQTNVIHIYKNAGHYIASLEIRPQNANTDLKLIPENVIDIQVDSIPLNISNSNSYSGDIVELETRFQNDDPLTRYRFFFGDNPVPSQWSSQSNTSHIYNTPSSYYVYAEIGKLSGQSIISVSRSVGKIVKVSFKPPPNHLWVYILVVLMAAITFLSIRKYYFSGRPLF